MITINNITRITTITITIIIIIIIMIIIIIRPLDHWFGWLAGWLAGWLGCLHKPNEVFAPSWSSAPYCQHAVDVGHNIYNMIYYTILYYNIIYYTITIFRDRPLECMFLKWLSGRNWYQQRHWPCAQSTKYVQYEPGCLAVWHKPWMHAGPSLEINL